MELNVDNQIINYTKIENEDYISITDMLKSKDGNFFVTDWLRNRNTIEFLGIWEELHNPNFNYGEFAIIKSQAGLNSYKLSVKEWVEKTNAIGIISIIIGLPGGFYLTDWLFKTAIEEHYDFGTNITIRTYVISAVGTFIVSYLVSKFLAKKIKKIDMVISLKGNE